MDEDKKIFKFRGKTLEQLQALSLEEYVALQTSRVRRKFKRGLLEQEQKLLDKIMNGERNIKTHSRDFIVLPKMVGNKIGIHNGKEFVQVQVIPEMLGMRLGELAPTRKIAVHSGSDDKKGGKK